MIERFASRVALPLMGVLTFTKLALADVPPPDACYKVDEPCTWGTGKVETGICREATCTRATPDGSVSYDCLRCVDEGTTSTDVSTTTGTSSQSTADESPGADASTMNGKEDPDCNCSVPGRLDEPWLSSVLLALGVGALRWSRRRTHS